MSWNYVSEYPVIVSIVILITAIGYLKEVLDVEEIKDIFAAEPMVDCPCRLPGCDKKVQKRKKYLMTPDCAKEFARFTTQYIKKSSSKNNCGYTNSTVTTYYSDSKICTEEGNPLYGKCIGPKKMKESSKIEFEERIHPIDRLQGDFDKWRDMAFRRIKNNNEGNKARAKAKKEKAPKMSPAEVAQRNAKARASRRRCSRFRAPSKLPTAENGGKTEKHANHPGIINEYNGDVSLYAKEMTEAMDKCPGT